jgi:hypothetical protein
MMLLPYPEDQQDSIRVKNIPIQDTVVLKSDTASLSVINQPGDSVPRRIRISVPKPVTEVTDTISVCRRNSIEDVTFYDSSNLVTRIYPSHRDTFPFLFTAKNRQIEAEVKASLIKQLRPGDEIPLNPLHNDWITIIILCSAFLFTLVRGSSATLFQGVERYFLFRGLNKPSTKDTGGIFTLDSTIKNLVSFLMFALFGYSAVSYSGFTQSAISGIIFWIIAVFTVITAVTMRHLACLIIGEVTTEREVFSEYLVTVYQFYRFGAISLFVAAILISYTTIFPVKLCISGGLIALAALYLIRVIRLFIIFINKNISFFYLILYLCALEILPVLISVKYISGLA